MNVSATSYVGGNSLQRHAVGSIIKKYANKIQWRSDGNDAVLDLGSGTGDITNDLILPILPAGFDKLIGVDLAEDMVEVANKRYSKPKVSFEQWDMGGNIELLSRRHPSGFDHIFSFFALHWLPKPELAIKNIYDLLRPNGDCFLVFIGCTDYLDVGEAVLKMPKWSKVITNPETMPLPYRYCQDRERVFQELLQSVGFRTFFVDTYISCFTFDSLDATKRAVSAVNSNLTLLTPTQKEEYFLDFVRAASELGVAECTNYPNNVRYTTTSKLLFAHAQK